MPKPFPFPTTGSSQESLPSSGLPIAADESSPDPEPPPPSLSPELLLSTLEETLALARRGLVSQPGGLWHLVIVPETGAAQRHTYATIEELVAQLRLLHGRPVQGFAFNGQALGVSKGGHYLITPWGKHALHVKLDDEEADAEGFLGAPRAPIVPLAAPEPEAGDEEEEELEDEEETVAPS